jgi:hypothetical protein
MGSAINGASNRNPVTELNNAQQAAPAATSNGPVKLLYGTAAQELTTMMNRLRQFPASAQALVSSRNPDLQ